MVPNFAQSRQTLSGVEGPPDRGLSGDSAKDPREQGQHGTSREGVGGHVPQISHPLFPSSLGWSGPQGNEGETLGDSLGPGSSVWACC